MKKVFAILLVLSFCFQIFIKTWIVQYYQLNKDFISAVLCINKDKPKMKCDGKCYLKKQLAKQAEQEKKAPTSTKEKFETLLFFDNPFSGSFQLISIQTHIILPDYRDRQISSPSFPVFQPPKFI